MSGSQPSILVIRGGAIGDFLLTLPALRLPAAALWAAIVVGRWLETQFAHPVAEYLLDTVLTNWEEGAKSLLREGFGAATRAANRAAKG